MRDERLGESQAHLKVNWIDVQLAKSTSYVCTLFSSQHHLPHS